MNADAMRQFYNYHFAMNRFIWNQYIVPLPQEQFVQPNAYSVGSVRDQVVHLLTVDDNWFNEVRGIDFAAWLPDITTDDRDEIRAIWDKVEQNMRGYLATLTDEMLLGKPVPDGEDKDLILWQILLHVANHATDHRAQLLRQLHDLGVETTAQDYVFFLYDQAQG